MNKKFLKNPPKKYRPSPFWSWNERLDVKETANQVDLMDKAGLGGFFMHARGGLKTEYLKDEWFDNIKAASEKANETGMLAWGYDENGWPSGFGCGAVNGLGVEYQQKYLRCQVTEGPETTDRTITNITVDGKNHHFYYDVNPFYVDVLNKKVIAKFLKSTHEKYIDNLGENLGGMTGFFTDEPQVSRNGYPWSFILEDEYKALYGDSLLEHLDALFCKVEGYTVVRYRYWKLVRDLFTSAFNEQIYNWCKAHGQLYTGHMTCEEDFAFQMQCHGSAMPNYEYMDIPGMDHLGRMLAETTTIMQLTSAANQLGKKQILSETFALCGWNVSFEELRWIYESQMVRGVNYLCQHLQGYSLRGIRKRDYPASLYRHQPWWKDYKTFNDMVSRIGMLIAEGDVDCNLLLLTNIESGWLTYNDNDPDGVAKTNAFCNDLKNIMDILERAQFNYHLGDNKIMEKYGKVSDKTLTVGSQNYSVVVVPPADCFGRATYELLKQFKAKGGKIIFTEKLPEYIDGALTDEWKILANGCPLVQRNELGDQIPASVRKITLDYPTADSQTVLTLTRRFNKDGMTMYYLVNPNNDEIKLTATVKGKSAEVFNAVSGETEPVFYKNSGENLSAQLTLEKRGSAVMFAYDDCRDQIQPADNACNSGLVPLDLGGEWQVEADLNALTLDYCDLYVNGQLVGENMPVSDAQEIACSYEKQVKVDLVYKFTIKSDDFATCRLAVETPDIFDITVNGVAADKTDLGFYHDPAFRLIDLRNLVKVGENQITLTCDFKQSDQVYQNMKNSLIFESEKNKLSYDMELEAVYIVGDFGVYTDGDFEVLDRRALRTDGGFYIANKPKTLRSGEIASQGYPFFAGSMTFKKVVNLTADDLKNRSVNFKTLCSSVTEVKINGVSAGKIMWQPYFVEAGDLLKVGENIIEITVTGNLRNLLGPFHLAEGESYWVAPPQFFHNSPLWVGGANNQWVDSYTFVEFGVFLGE